MRHRNLAVELLQRPLKGEIKVRAERNIVQARSFADLLEKSIRKYQNRAIEAVQDIEELIRLANDIKAADARGEQLGLTSDELAFYDALAENDSAVHVLGDATLRVIAHELVDTVRRNASIDWTLRENVQAQMRVYVKRILRKYTSSSTSGVARETAARQRPSHRAPVVHRSLGSTTAGRAPRLWIEQGSCN